MTTFEAALEYIRNDGLSSQKYVNVYVNGKSKSMLKNSIYSLSKPISDSNTSDYGLLKLLQLIENEDVTNIKTRLSTWKQSHKLFNRKNSTTTNDVSKENQNNSCSSFSKIPNELKENNDICEIKGIGKCDSQPVSVDKSGHDCHPLCVCHQEQYPAASSPASTASYLNFSYASVSVILHSRDDLGRTPLHIASIVGNPLTVELLLSQNDFNVISLYKSGNFINCKDVNGMTPLHYACLRGHQNVLLLLLHADAYHNACDIKNNTALHLAANHGHSSCIKALIYYAEHKSLELDINAQNSFGDTPLHLAAKWGFSNAVEILLSHGARYILSSCLSCSKFNHTFLYMLKIMQESFLIFN